jgi:hypothetical protein
MRSRAQKPLREAAFYGRLEVLKKARLDPGKDDIVELLAAASFYRDPQVVEYLLSFSPDLAKPRSDGETVMDSFFSKSALGLGSDIYAQGFQSNDPVHREVGEARC